MKSGFFLDQFPGSTLQGIKNFCVVDDLFQKKKEGTCLER
jgi:hypothetical protein